MTRLKTVMKNETHNQVKKNLPTQIILKARLRRNLQVDHTLTKRRHFFSHVPEEKWNDWKWQFRNRITTIDELAQFIPLSTREQAQLKLVTLHLPLINNSLLSQSYQSQTIPMILSGSRQYLLLKRLPLLVWAMRILSTKREIP